MRAYMDPRFERLPDQLPINRAVQPEWAVASFLRHGFVFTPRRAAAIERASTIYVQHRIIAPKLFKIQQIRWRRGESNDTRLLILRNLLQTYERKNRITLCMTPSVVQNHVQQIERGSPFKTVSDASGYSRKASSISREMFRSRSKRSSGRLTTRPPRGPVHREARWRRLDEHAVL